MTLDITEHKATKWLYPIGDSQGSLLQSSTKQDKATNQRKNYS